jgi:hypothetical protein
VQATQVVKGVAALALVALSTAVGASATPPPTSVTCSVGGKTSFAHAPRGTNSVTFVYGALADVVTWVGGQRSFATPTDVAGDTSVVATFYDGATQLATAQTTCS